MTAYQPASSLRLSEHTSNLHPTGEALASNLHPTDEPPAYAVAAEKVEVGLYPALDQQQPAQPSSLKPRDVAVSHLESLGFPRGLANEMYSSCEVFPYRFWVVDNSGSMNSGDGSRLVMNKDKSAARVVKSTRWNELCDVVTSIGEVACAMGAHTEFRLLNRPAGKHASRQRMLVGGDAASAAVPTATKQVDLATLCETMQGVSPSGSTPLTEALMEIVSLLTPVAEQLRTRGQQAVVVLATDGMPNNKSTFMQALSALQALPVWVVIRLCTDDDGVVEYYNELDQALEAPLEVLDDEGGEAIEVTQNNRWLNYAPQLHRAREWGLQNKLFDLLDEAALMPFQQRQFVELLLGCEPLPEPELDAAAFRAAVHVALKSLPPVYDPVVKQMRPWVTSSLLLQKSCVQGGCSIM